MIPRGTPDIGWIDLLAGLFDCTRPLDERRAALAAERAFAAENTMACLSVRSGFDLALQAMALPAGSEVLVSPISIPAMFQLLAAHQLLAVPVDLDPASLALDAAALEQAITPRSRAILVAHLFGSRMPMQPIIDLAQRYGLLLFEDCAQAYTGDAYRGHQASDVSMFSFGPIKTHTALGGALVRFRDPAICERARILQALYPVQPRPAYARRLALFLALKALAKPPAFRLFVTLCRLSASDADRLLSSVMRSFPGADLLGKIRRRPCAPLLSMLARRLRRPAAPSVRRRIAYARRLYGRLKPGSHPGARAPFHSHWVLPLLSRDPAGLVRLLQLSGFDATRTASSLCVADEPAGLPEATRARQLMERMLYLPVFPAMSEQLMERMTKIIADFETAPPLIAPTDQQRRA